MKRSRTKHKSVSTLAPRTADSMAALAGGMADDFNNILTTVMGACSIIDRDDSANGELLQCVALIRASAEHAADLSDRLARAGTPGDGGLHPGSRPPGSVPAAASLRDKKRIDGVLSADNTPGGTPS